MLCISLAAAPPLPPRLLATLPLRPPERLLRRIRLDPRLRLPIMINKVYEYYIYTLFVYNNQRLLLARLRLRGLPTRLRLAMIV